MRRMFQDLTRKAGVDGVVAMAISRHATDAMRVRYSIASTPEVAGELLGYELRQPNHDAARDWKNAMSGSWRSWSVCSIARRCSILSDA